MQAIAAAPAPARAETADRFGAALQFVPIEAAPDERPLIEFLDMRTAAALTGERGGAALLRLANRIAVSPATNALGRAATDQAEWVRATGFGLEHIDRLLLFGYSPRTAMLYALNPDAPDTAALQRAWVARAFALIRTGPVTLWGRGAPFKINLQERNPSDPFGGAFGRGSFLLWTPPDLVESTDPEMLAAVASARSTGGLAARADIAAMLTALGREFPGASLLQAVLFSHPDRTLTATNGGIPPYSALLVADLERGDAGAATVFLVAFSDCAIARAALEAMTRHKANAPDLAFMPVLEWRIAGTANPCPVVGVAQVLGAPAQRNFNNRFYPGMLGALYAKRIDALLMRRGR